MLPKERVIRALNHQEPDRVPTGEIGIDYPITERVLGRETFYRAKWKEMIALWDGRRDEVVESTKRDLVDLVRKLELDFVPVFFVPPKGHRPQKPKFLDTYTWEDEVGRIWKFSPESEGWPLCIQEVDVSLEEIKVPSTVEIDESELELVRYVVNELGDTHFILGRDADGTFPCPGGITSFLLKMIAEPEFVSKAIQASTKTAIARGNALIEAGCDGILMGADYCENRGPMMSPHHFREYIFPSLKEHCTAFHKAGVWAIKHTDGNTWPIMDMMLETGIDGLHGIQTTAGMDMRELKEKVGDRIALWGAIDCDLLIRGTEEAVAREVEYDITSAGPGGGLIVTSGNTIMVGVRYENYMAMLKTVRDKGRYPICA